MKLEKGIPIPPVSGLTKWPFGEMEVGDSFTVPPETRERCRSAAASYARQHSGWTYTLQKVDAETWRCWRIP